MNKRRWRSRLSWELLLAVFCAFLLAAAAFMGIREAAFGLIDRSTQAEDFQRRQEETCSEAFQTYVSQNAIPLTNLIRIDEWAQKERYVNLTVIQDAQLIYDSSVSPEASPEYYAEDVSYYPWMNYYDIQFADGTARAAFSCYYEFEYYNLAIASAYLMGFLVFVAVLLLLIRRKTAYITQMERELRILEGGDLGYEVTERGRDELCELARGINDMRRAVIERQSGEDEIRTANHELITAMSHDLRTPLTALIGYLDILELGRYSGEEQQRHFLRSSRQKAFQIKALSDKLFEYFLVYGKNAEELELEQADAAELLRQTVGESLFELESQGFPVEWELPELHVTLSIHTGLFRRVFDNIFSNVLKYADRSSPVRVVCRMEDGGLSVEVGNAIDPGRGARESTGIGLKTCEKIMRDHGGRFHAREQDGVYRVRLWFPAERPGRSGRRKDKEGQPA